MPGVVAEMLPCHLFHSCLVNPVLTSHGATHAFHSERLFYEFTRAVILAGVTPEKVMQPGNRGIQHVVFTFIEGDFELCERCFHDIIISSSSHHRSPSLNSSQGM